MGNGGQEGRLLTLVNNKVSYGFLDTQTICHINFDLQYSKLQERYMASIQERDL